MNEANTNIIQFPSLQARPSSQTFDQFIEMARASRTNHIDTVAKNILDFVYYRIEEEGFDINKDDCELLSLMLDETLKGLLCQSMGIETPICSLADEHFNIVKDEDEPA